jgi:hypothetical protein
MSVTPQVNYLRSNQIKSKAFFYGNLTATIKTREMSPKLHCKDNSIYIIPERKLRGLIPNFSIHISAAPTLKQNPKKRKRSDDTVSGSGSGSGTGNQRGPSAQQAHLNRQSGQSRDSSRDRNRDYGSTSQQFGGGYGSGCGSSRQVSYPPSVYNPSRGRAGSLSSRGTSGYVGNRVCLLC